MPSRTQIPENHFIVAKVPCLPGVVPANESIRRCSRAAADWTRFQTRYQIWWTLIVFVEPCASLGRPAVMTIRSAVLTRLIARSRCPMASNIAV